MKKRYQNQVRMHDTDLAGILYFANQFRFVHDAFEDYMEDLGFSFKHIFSISEFGFVIVHAESDYLKSLMVGDKLSVEVQVSNIGDSSFTMSYLIYRDSEELVGKAKTVHVAVNKEKRAKISIPDELRTILETQKKKSVNTK